MEENCFGNVWFVLMGMFGGWWWSVVVFYVWWLVVGGGLLCLVVGGGGGLTLTEDLSSPGPTLVLPSVSLTTHICHLL